MSEQREGVSKIQPVNAFRSIIQPILTTKLKYHPNFVPPILPFIVKKCETSCLSVLWARMQKQFECNGTPVLLDTPEKATQSVVLFVPGVSGKGRGERFLPLVDVVLASNMAIARLDMWESQDELNELTINAIHEKLKAVTDTLVSFGYTSVITVGKSLGGGLTLTFAHPAVTKKIAWAPAFGYSEVGNFFEMSNVPLGTIASTRDVRMGNDTLHSIQVPVFIIHGTSDDTIPLDNSQAIIHVISHGTLIEIPGADHSFKTIQDERSLMETTKLLLQ